MFLNYKNNKALENYTFSTDINSVLVGDSHVQYCINDKKTPNIINIAKLSEAPYYTFYKLGPILKNNPAIKKVYLGFSYHTISSYTSINIFGSYSKDIAPRYFFILPFKEKVKMISKNVNNLSPFLSNIFYNGFYTLRTKNRDYSFMGGYVNNFYSTSAIKASMDKRIALQFYENDTLRDFSSINILYLNKIIALCKKQNVELIIFNAPLHPYYKSKIPQKFYDKFEELLAINHLKQVSFENLILTDSCFAPDGDHVSVKGAELTTANFMKY